jgi:tRNA 2-thiouridine synthesizing protein E
LDFNGFLDPPEQWNEEFAEEMAKELGVRSLTERHWKIIRYLRHKFTVEKTVPVLVHACMDNDMSLAEMRSRFPTGYHRGACKIAGINYKFMYDTNVWITHETAPPPKPRYKLDRLGFLEDFRQWDLDFPEYMMNELKRSGGPTERQWEVIRYLRDYRIMKMMMEGHKWWGDLPFEITNVLEWTAEHIKEGKLQFDKSKNPQRVTYHDPCNFARSCDIAEAPRVILDAFTKRKSRSAGSTICFPARSSSKEKPPSEPSTEVTIS